MSMTFEKRTHKSFREAHEELKKNLKEVGFGVLWEMNFKDKLNEKGLDFQKNFQVMEVCNPSKAKVVLDAHLEAGYLLPCKVVVFEKSDGVHVGMMRPTMLSNIMEGVHLGNVALEVENSLKEAIEKTI
jgi:uncharacterized protein (DUF302 family)